MKEEMKQQLKQLLANKELTLIIGCKYDELNQVVPVFCTSESDVDTINDEIDSPLNLASYLKKPEVKAFKNIGIIANEKIVKTLYRLAEEHQLTTLSVWAIIVDSDKGVTILHNSDEFKSWLTDNIQENNSTDDINQILNMSREQRMAYWQAMFSNCVKCYACRAACPLCYCPRCAIEINRPQWIKTSASTQGNAEWHMSHAMHLAGRCTVCESCSNACPVGIPVHLLTKNIQAVLSAGLKNADNANEKGVYPLNSFQVDDKENFFL